MTELFVYNKSYEQYLILILRTILSQAFTIDVQH